MKKSKVRLNHLLLFSLFFALVGAVSKAATIAEHPANQPGIYNDLTQSFTGLKQTLIRLYSITKNRVDFIKEVSSETEIIIISAPWCGACKQLKATLAEAGRSKFFPFKFMGTRLNIPVKIDESEDRLVKVSEKTTYQVTAYPTILLVYKKQVVSSFRGNAPDILEGLMSLFLNSAEAGVGIIGPSKYAQDPSPKSSVMILGTGGKNLNYSSYQIIRIIQKKLSSWSMGAFNFTSLYGTIRDNAVKGSTAYDVEISLGDSGSLYMNFLDPSRKGPLTEKRLARANRATQNSQNRLWIVVGHGQPSKMPSFDGGITAATMKNIITSENSNKQQNIIINGSCFSGSFYDVPTCGFFAAHPETTSSGCYSGIEDVSPYYLSKFFQGTDDASADVNQDGKVSFIEAHNYATINGVPQDNPYTSLDGYAREAFVNKRIVHNESMTWEVFEELLLKYASRDDLFVYRDLKFKRFALTKWWYSYKSDNTLSYEPQILLFRRVMFRKFVEENPNSNEAIILDRIDSCQNQGVREFLTQ